jgi:hypothetical protein
MEPLVLGGVAFLALASVCYLLPRYVSHPRYGPPSYREALQQFDRDASEGAALLTLDQNAHLAFNFQRRANRRYGLSGEDLLPLDERLSGLLDRISASHDEIWILASGVRIGGVERTLRSRLLRMEQYEYQEVRLLRLRRFEGEIPSSSLRQQSLFGGQIRLEAVDLKAGLAPGERLPVDLYWRALSRPDKSLTVSLQVLDEAGRLVAQDDGPPAGGMLPTIDWLPDKVVLDSRQVDLPASLPPGSYSLAVVLYDSAAGQRLLLADGKDAAVVAILRH